MASMVEIIFEGKGSKFIRESELFGRLDFDLRTNSILAGKLGSIFVLLLQLLVGQSDPNDDTCGGLLLGCADAVENRWFAH